MRLFLTGLVGARILEEKRTSTTITTKTPNTNSNPKPQNINYQSVSTSILLKSYVRLGAKKLGANS